MFAIISETSKHAQEAVGAATYAYLQMERATVPHMYKGIVAHIKQKVKFYF